MELGMEFSKVLEAEADALQRIRRAAHELHASVNQLYGSGLPYAYHLDGVAEGVARYGGEVCVREDDVLPLMFGAWFHDSIEDARQTYNDTRKRAADLGLDERQALLAAEIVYALTNDKGTHAGRKGGREVLRGHPRHALRPVGQVGRPRGQCPLFRRPEVGGQPAHGRCLPPGVSPTSLPP